MNPLVLILMGVSGSGKSTIGAMLAERLGSVFADGDSFHSAANIAKMRAGIPLDDADRKPWLAAIAAQIDAWRADNQRGVIACSALKRSYRQILVGGRANVRIVYLEGDKDVITARLAARHGHFMPAALVDSQFEALEEPAPDEHALTIQIDAPPSVIVERIRNALDD